MKCGVALGLKKILVTSESIKSFILKVKNFRNYQKTSDDLKKCIKSIESDHVLDFVCKLNWGDPNQAKNATIEPTKIFTVQ